MEKENIRITGVMFYYYFVCKRKLWYFSKNIQMEQNDENVEIGKLIDENSYNRENKNILIDGIINIDFIENKKVIHEVKKSRTFQESSHWQLKYYIYYLNKKGMKNITGIIDYPLLKKREKLELSQKDIEKIEEIIKEINKIITKKKIPKKINNICLCKKCSYYELCFI